MARSIEDEFVLLDQDRQDMVGGQFLTRSTHVSTEAGPVLVGLDMYGLRHLLVPTTGMESIPEDRRSAGVSLVGQTLLVNDTEVLYADLVCRFPELSLVFERLVQDVIERLETSPAEVIPVLHQTLDQWRRLFQKGPTGLGRDAAVGLTGELEVLHRLAQRGPQTALEAWRGPQGAVHDFVSGADALEVKSTASVDGNSVEISNLDQLDATDLSTLHLVVVHLRPNDAAPSIDDRIRDLLSMGVPRGNLLDLLADVGHVFEARDVEEHRYAVRHVRIWRVDPAFPGLRRSVIKEQALTGVGHVRYQLAVDSAPAPIGDEDQFFERWLGLP